MLIAPERCHSHCKEALEGVLTHTHHLHIFLLLYFVGVEVGDWVMQVKINIKDADGFCDSSTEVGSWLRSSSHPFNGPQHPIRAVH